MNYGKPQPKPEASPRVALRIVCMYCAEAFWPVPDGRVGHYCDPATIAHFNRDGKGRAELQAKGLAACEGRARTVHYSQGGYDGQ